MLAPFICSYKLLMISLVLHLEDFDRFNWFSPTQALYSTLYVPAVGRKRVSFSSAHWFKLFSNLIIWSKASNVFTSRYIWKIEWLDSEFRYRLVGVVSDIGVMAIRSTILKTPSKSSNFKPVCTIFKYVDIVGFTSGSPFCVPSDWIERPISSKIETALTNRTSLFFLAWLTGISHKLFNNELYVSISGRIL